MCISYTIATVKARDSTNIKLLKVYQDNCLKYIKHRTINIISD